MRYITTEVEVDVFDLLEETDDDDLVRELKERGYRVDQPAEYLSDEELIYNIEGRGYRVENEYQYDSSTFKRKVCDMLGVGYHTDVETLISIVRERIGG